jgi:hypothetical protein
MTESLRIPEEKIVGISTHLIGLPLAALDAFTGSSGYSKSGSQNGLLGSTGLSCTNTLM